MPTKVKPKEIISNYYKTNMPIDLAIAERIQLIGVFNQVKGDVETLQAVLEDVKQVSLTEEEKKEMNFREVKGIDPQDQVEKVLSYAWDIAPAKAITLSDKTKKFVLKFIDEKSKAEELSLVDAPLLEINRKLKEHE